VRQWFFELSIALVDQGADPQSALALAHGLAHNLALEEFSWNLRSGEAARGKPWHLRVPPEKIASAILSGKIKISRRPVLSMATERRMRRAGSKP
jgi:hypothetical protein